VQTFGLLTRWKQICSFAGDLRIAKPYSASRRTIAFLPPARVAL
jgi:hypothetical protein